MSCSYYTLVHHACLWKISKPIVPCSPIHLHSQLSSNLHYYYYILPGLQLLFLRLFFQCLFPLISWSLKKQNNCIVLSSFLDKVNWMCNQIPDQKLYVPFFFHAHFLLLREISTYNAESHWENWGAQAAAAYLQWAEVQCRRQMWIDWSRCSKEVQRYFQSSFQNRDLTGACKTHEPTPWLKEHCSSISSLPWRCKFVSGFTSEFEIVRLGWRQWTTNPNKVFKKTCPALWITISYCQEFHTWTENIMCILCLWIPKWFKICNAGHLQVCFGADASCSGADVFAAVVAMISASYAFVSSNYACLSNMKASQKPEKSKRTNSAVRFKIQTISIYVCITWSNRFCSGSIKSIRTLKPLWSVSIRICYLISLKSCNINHLLMEKPLQCKCKRLQNSVDRHFPYMFVWEEKGMANWSKKKTEIWCIVLGAPSCYVWWQ